MILFPETPKKVEKILIQKEINRNGSNCNVDSCRSAVSG